MVPRTLVSHRVFEATSRVVLACAVLVLAAGQASALVLWDESIHGDLSTDPAAPSTATLVTGWPG